MTDEIAARLAGRLAHARRLVAVLPVENDEKAIATRRLSAIDAAVRQDPRRAAQQLDAFLADLSDGETAS